ncbi:hypothetical protein JL720_1100 [Aureococcus anophagefferens]|nr:hypothetical protein JL720_1100 [Aureococcus anophagefferens]
MLKQQVDYAAAPPDAAGAVEPLVEKAAAEKATFPYMSTMFSMEDKAAKAKADADRARARADAVEARRRAWEAWLVGAYENLAAANAAAVTKEREALKATLREREAAIAALLGESELESAKESRAVAALRARRSALSFVEEQTLESDRRAEVREAAAAHRERLRDEKAAFEAKSDLLERAVDAAAASHRAAAERMGAAEERALRLSSRQAAARRTRRRAPSRPGRTSSGASCPGRPRQGPGGEDADADRLAAEHRRASKARATLLAVEASRRRDEAAAVHALAKLPAATSSRPPRAAPRPRVGEAREATAGDLEEASDAQSRARDVLGAAEADLKAAQGALKDHAASTHGTKLRHALDADEHVLARHESAKFSIDGHEAKKAALRKDIADVHADWETESVSLRAKLHGAECQLKLLSDDARAAEMVQRDILETGSI